MKTPRRLAAYLGFDVDPADLDHNTDGLLDQFDKDWCVATHTHIFVKGDVVKGGIHEILFPLFLSLFICFIIHLF